MADKIKAQDYTVLIGRKANQTIPAKSGTTAGTLTVDFSTELGGLSIYQGMFGIGNYLLPFHSSTGEAQTWADTLTNSSKSVVFYNTRTSAWSNMSIYYVLFCK